MAKLFNLSSVFIYKLALFIVVANVRDLSLSFLYRNFMIQGGDPTGTGKGGESIWGQPFNDELNSKLVHSGRGVVSMANSGPHTNGSQFFILYKSANHLNFKHTVFGGVVGGLTTLAAMEKVPVDDDDRPLVCLLSYLFVYFIFSVLDIYSFV